MVQQNILNTFIHHKFIMQTHLLENLFFASYSFKDLRHALYNDIFTYRENDTLSVVIGVDKIFISKILLVYIETRN